MASQISLPVHSQLLLEEKHSVQKKGPWNMFVEVAAG